jgi:hypothetical protein
MTKSDYYSWPFAAGRLPPFVSKVRAVPDADVVAETVLT